MKKKRFIIVGMIVLGALSYVAYTTFQHATTYYYSVSELEAQSAFLGGEKVRVNGVLTAVTSEIGTGKPQVNFTISSGGKDLPAIYRGTVPDAFQVGNEVVIEGRRGSAGIFQAETIITKCPSKYEPANQ